MTRVEKKNWEKSEKKTNRDQIKQLHKIIINLTKILNYI